MTYGTQIAGAAAGTFVKLAKVRPVGGLFFRKETDGTVALYWRYAIGTQSVRERIGVWDSQAPPKSLKPTARGYSIPAAIYAAEARALDHQQRRAEGGRPALLAAEREHVRQVQQAADDQAQVEAQAEVDRSKHTVQSLMDSYADDLEGRRKKPARTVTDVRSIFRIHVTEAWPKFAALPANELTPEQVADMMRLLHKNNHGRTANKLRSYLGAAYEVARTASSTPETPEAFKAFGVRFNPASGTKRHAESDRDDKNPLTVDELRMYWRAIEKLEGLRGSALRLHMLTGGQRLTQFCQLKTNDIRSDHIILWDTKGRSAVPRSHEVPLIEAAAENLKQCKPVAGKYAISTDGGETYLNDATLSQWATEAQPMVTVDGVERPAIYGFQTKRLRSGIETLLASMQVSPTERGRLLSHGNAGVQKRHYDGYDYLPVKLRLLEMVYEQIIKRPGSSVTPLRRAIAAA